MCWPRYTLMISGYWWIEFLSILWFDFDSKASTSSVSRTVCSVAHTLICLWWPATTSTLAATYWFSFFYYYHLKWVESYFTVELCRVHWFTQPLHARSPSLSHKHIDNRPVCEQSLLSLNTQIKSINQIKHDHAWEKGLLLVFPCREITPNSWRDSILSSRIVRIILHLCTNMSKTDAFVTSDYLVYLCS